MGDGPLAVSHRDGGAWLTLDRPGKRNALSDELLAALDTALDEARDDDDVACVVLAGTEAAFSSGYDLVEEVTADPPDAAAWYDRLDRYVRLTTRVVEYPKPVVAVVRGWCLAGGFELAMAADLVYATPDAHFGEPEIQHGSGPVTLVMPFVVGWRRAAELLLLGRVIDATSAREAGMVTEVVDADGIDEHVTAVCRHLATTPQAALRFTKQALIAARRATGTTTAFDANLALHAVLNGSPTPEKLEFNAIVRDAGLRAALAWRAERYTQAPAPPTTVQPSPDEAAPTEPRGDGRHDVTVTGR